MNRNHNALAVAIVTISIALGSPEHCQPWCQTGECLPPEKICNDFKDCPLGEDEAACPEGEWEYGFSSPNGVIMSDNYPFSYQKRIHHFTILADGDVCFTFKKFNLDYDQTLGIMDRLVFRTNNNGDGDFSYSRMGQIVVPPAKDVPGHLRDVWGADFCLSPFYRQGYGWVLPMRLEGVYPGSGAAYRPDQPFGFYAEYHVVSGGFGEPRPSPDDVICDVESEFRCYGTNTTCIDATDICGPNAKCPDGSDVSFAHARCTDDDWDWDLEEPLRSAVLVASRDSRNWLSRAVEDLYDVTGLATDHTQLPHSRRGYIAVDGISPTASLRIDSRHNGDSCLSFWYYMHGQQTMNLTITKNDYNYPKILWLRLGDQGDTWRPGQVDFPERVRQILIYSEIVPGQPGVVALDDIAWLPGRCIDRGDVSTTFASGSADWKYENAGTNIKYDWHNQAGKYRSYSFYRLKMNNYRDTWSMTSPISTVLQKTMWFYFRYSSTTHTSKASVNVLTSKGTVLFSTSLTLQPSHRFVRRADFALPAQREPFQILTTFEAGYYGCISTPTVLYDQRIVPYTCQEDEFHCGVGGGGCVPAWAQCDGEIDCADGSDEATNCPLASWVISLAIVVPILCVVMIAIFMFKLRKRSLALRTTSDTAPGTTMSSVRSQGQGPPQGVDNEVFTSEPLPPFAIADSPPCYTEACVMPSPDNGGTGTGNDWQPPPPYSEAPPPKYDSLVESETSLSTMV